MNNTQASPEQATFSNTTGVLNLLDAQTQIQFQVPANLTFRPGIVQMLEAGTQIQFSLPAQEQVQSVSVIDSLTQLTLVANRQYAHA